MINAVTVINYLGNALTMELASPEKSGLAITNIEGIGASKADINMTKIATDDGAIFNSARSGSRNITIKFEYMWVPDIEATRHRCYEYFPIKKPVTLIFETDYRISRISGYVESNEPDIFSKEEGSTVSIICPDPYFYSLIDGGVKTTVFSGVKDVFEFPFSNESLTENQIVFSESYNLVQQCITYEGDADIGVLITIKSSGTAKNITIANTETKEQMTINTEKIIKVVGGQDANLIDEDVIQISTVKGSKHVMLIRSGKFYNILSCLSKNADWIKLSKGDNIIAYMAEEGFLNLSFKVENNTIYQGV